MQFNSSNNLQIFSYLSNQLFIALLGPGQPKKWHTNCIKVTHILQLFFWVSCTHPTGVENSPPNSYRGDTIWARAHWLPISYKYRNIFPLKKDYLILFISQLRFHFRVLCYLKYHMMLHENTFRFGKSLAQCNIID